MNPMFLVPVLRNLLTHKLKCPHCGTLQNKTDESGNTRIRCIECGGILYPKPADDKHADDRPPKE